MTNPHDIITSFDGEQTEYNRLVREKIDIREAEYDASLAMNTYIEEQLDRDPLRQGPAEQTEYDIEPF